MAKRPRLASQSSEHSALAEHASKYTTIDNVTAKGGHQGPGPLRCDLHSQTLVFDTMDEYETHYNKSHQNRCTECKKNFPSAHILDLHIAEQHDAFVAARKERGEKTYTCFVEGCDKACLDWKKRRSHLIDKHGFPKNFDFFIVANGIDGRKSLLRAGVDADGHRASSRERGTGGTTSASQVETEDEIHQTRIAEPGKGTERGKAGPAESQEQHSVAELTSSMSALRMIPRNVQFGRGRAGLSRD